MSKGQIFISYRRDDAAGYARALYDRLVQHFSSERVFMDVDAIEPGLPFDEVIQQALSRCEVLLVVIGRRWLDPQPGLGSRLENPEDFVRLEIAAALARDIRVIPVLLDGATMPTPADLPDPLQALTRRNAIEVSNSRFRADSERLIAIVRKVLGESDGPGPLAPARKGTYLRYGLSGGVAVGVLMAMVYFWGPHQAPESLVPANRPQNADDGGTNSGRSIRDRRPEINGVWEADVSYDWPNARYTERFDFRGEGDEVYGTASFLGKRRGILEGRIEKDRLRFITRTQEVLGDWQNPKDVVHRYRGKFRGNAIEFVMQTEGGYSEHIPIEFRATRRSPPSASPQQKTLSQD